jgi:hypothetical protein
MSELQDKNELIKMYLERDNNLKLNPMDQILSCLTKLRYYNINLNNELEKSIKYNYKLNLDNLTDYSYNEYKKFFINTNEYSKIEQAIYNKLNRSINLSKFIGTDLIIDFYNKCSYDELVYLGY